MKSFFEKVRDFFYDSIDYIIILAIIVGVILIINWRLDGLFAEENPDLSSKGNEAIEDSQPDNSEDTDESEDTNESDEKDEANEAVEDIEDKDEEATREKDESSEAIIKIDIPSGSGSSSIAKILKDKGLIEDETEFVDTVVKLRYDTKLRYGEYEIPENSSLEEILEILIK